MIHIFLNGLGASAGAGLTYLANVIPYLSSSPEVRTTLAVQPRLQPSFANLENVSLAAVPERSTTARRFWFEQVRLPALINGSGADVLVSAGNFALRNSPVPQILLSGNSLYTSAHFLDDLRSRREYLLWLDTRIKGAFAKMSVHWADCTVAPSRAFADELQQWTGKHVSALHHGFNESVFFGDSSPLPHEVQLALDARRDCLRVLFVSHYNYYRNFETLFRAIPLLRQKLNGRKVRIFLTCKLRDSANPGTYRTRRAAALIKHLGIAEEIVELGAVPYRLLHHVYKACDIYVTPAYAETFAHPLVEAMASGLPIAACDLPVHREVCGIAALYFPPFSPESLADTVCQITASSEWAGKLRESGIRRASEFSWRGHVEELVSLASALRSRARRVDQTCLIAAGAGFP
jgi:glycosyltransferase involved in cell wall biosynthesis